MDIAELKLRVMEKVTANDDKNLLNSILESLSKAERDKEKVHDLSRHFESISQRYDETLKKLAK